MIGVIQQLERALASPALKRMAFTAAESRLVAETVEKVLASPEVHAALARQSRGFAGEVAAALRRLAGRLDQRLSVGAARQGDGYAGVVSRMAALTVDAVLVHLIVLVPALFVALIASLFGGLPRNLVVDALAFVGWFVIAAAYFVAFWSTLGQTPGERLTGFHVVDHRGRSPSLGRSLVRLIGLALAVIPLFAGFLPVFFDRRRRALQDYLAGTDVVAGHD